MGVTDGAFKVKMHHPFSRTRILRQSGSSPTGLICFAMNKKHRRTPQHPTVTWHWLPMTTAHLTWDSTCHMLLLLLSFPKWWQNGWCHENGEERNEIWDRSKVKALTMQKQVFCWDVLSYFPHSAESSQPSFPSMRNLELVRCTMMFFFTPHTGYKDHSSPYPGFVLLSHVRSDVKIRGEGYPLNHGLGIWISIFTYLWQTGRQHYMVLRA